MDRHPPSPIPSMGGTEIGGVLRQISRDAESAHHIVEVGSWLGAGTWALADGMRQSGATRLSGHPRLHVFDRFRLSREGKAKAVKAGLSVRSHQNTLPIVQQHLAPLDVPIGWHKGSILEKTWPADWPIGVYVDDAAKTQELFNHVLHCFAPAWVPGTTVLVLMDFNYWQSVQNPEDKARFRWQADLVAQFPESFEPLDDLESHDSNVAYFRYGAPLDLSQIPREPTKALRRWRQWRHRAQFT